MISFLTQYRLIITVLRKCSKRATNLVDRIDTFWIRLKPWLSVKFLFYKHFACFYFACLSQVNSTTSNIIFVARLIFIVNKKQEVG